MKIAWIDIESSGLDAEKNDVLSLSIIIDINGKIEKTINLKMQPHSWDNIDDKALEVNGFTREQIKTFDLPEIALEKLITILSKYVNRYDKNDKLHLAGYNIKKFDIDFMEQFFKKCGDDYFWSWFHSVKFDMYDGVQFFILKGYFSDMENIRLKDVAEELGITIKAHDAQSDVSATRDVCYKLLEKIKDNK